MIDEGNGSDRPGATTMDCERVVERLVSDQASGHPAARADADDGAVAEHLRSCLGCFRAAADLRQAPRLAALLRKGLPEDAPGAPDPGPAFWASFSSELGERFAERVPARADRAPAAAGALSPWQRFMAWIRMPVPAAMVGAACATAVAMVMTRPPSLQSLGQGPAAGGVDEAAPDVLLTQESDDVAFAQSPSVYESVQELDTQALAHVRDSFGRAFDRALTTRTTLTSGSDDDLALSTTAAVPDPATVSEELEELDVRGLSALRDQLGSGR